MNIKKRLFGFKLEPEPEKGEVRNTTPEVYSADYKWEVQVVDSLVGYSGYYSTITIPVVPTGRWKIVDYGKNGKEVFIEVDFLEDSSEIKSRLRADYPRWVDYSKVKLRQIPNETIFTCGENNATK